jgi:hypothetical protein
VLLTEAQIQTRAVSPADDVAVGVDEQLVDGHATARVLPWPDRASHYERHHELTDHRPRALLGKDSSAPFSVS